MKGEGIKRGGETEEKREAKGGIRGEDKLGEKGKSRGD